MNINSSQMPKEAALKKPKLWFCLSLFGFIVIAMLGFWTVSDYGMTWDEPFRFEGGDSKLEYYEELFSGKDPAPQKSSYPGLFDLPVAMAHQVFPEWGTRSEKGHVWSLCFGLLGLLSVWRLTARIGGERAGFWALLFLATLPRYYGHMFSNPKDIPLAGMYAFGIWALVTLFARLPQVPWRTVLWIGASAGLAMSCRIAGFLILVYFGLFVGLYLLLQYGRQRIPVADLAKALLIWASRGAVAGLLATGILLVFWPTLHVNPFSAVESSVENVQNFGWGGMVLMDGHFWEAQDLPFYYLPYWLMRTTPEHLLLLMGGGFILGFLQLYRNVRTAEWGQAELLLPRVVLVVSGIFPIIYIIWKDPVLYDGMRHILFAMPPLVAVAALTFEECLRWSDRLASRFVAVALQVGSALAVGLVLLTMWLLHPYQYVFFNQLSGGLPGAYNRDETDYWGLSHKEAGEWLNRYAESIDPEGRQVFKAHQRYSRWMLSEALDPKRFEMWQPKEGADFFVSVTRFNLHTSYPEAKLLHVVERQGVPLCFIYSFIEETAE